MPLAPRTRLGAFEIIEMVGAGGMGEVYRARDTRLDRTVAIKILPPDFPHAGGARERFEREARSISSLNHPNICVLHDIGSQDGIDYLVLEFLDGESLAVMLDRGALLRADAVRIGMQIAAALEAAHSAGVFHRDLKPGNVIVTRSGAKLLDFGLAKMSRAAAGVGSNSQELTRTAAGTIQGTLQYMAPEQLEGKDADARSDIFAFGCVMYEMLSGRKAFPGESAASVIAAIMSAKPAPVSDDPAPQDALQRVVNACLTKDPADRFQSARDLRRVLDWSQIEQSKTTATVPHRRAARWISIACVAAAVLLGWALGSRRPAIPPATRVTQRFAINEPEDVWLQEFISQQSIAISPVGGRIAMIAASGHHGPQIWIRNPESLLPAPLAGTEGALFVFWSPDSKSLGFFANGKLKRVAIDGGAPVAICDLTGGWAGTWGANGDIIITLFRGASVRVRVDSGVVTEGTPALWPRFLADGKYVVGVVPQQGDLVAQLEDFSTGKTIPLVKTNTQAIFVPETIGARRGHLVFGRDSTLLAQPMELDPPAMRGEAVPITGQVPFFRPTAWSEFDASQDGHLIVGSGISQTNLIWVTRTGARQPVTTDVHQIWAFARVAPGPSARIAVDVWDTAVGGTDLWVLDQRTGAGERLTFDPGVESSPVWSPDGRRIAFGSAQVSAPQLRVLTVGESGPPAEYPAGQFQLPVDWSSDGRWIAYHTTGGDLPGEIWFASGESDRKIYPVVQRKPLSSVAPAFSPDGKYLAYASNESGRFEVYVQGLDVSVPPHTTGERQRVSLSGGKVPRWRRDGSELFFLSPDLAIMSSTVKRGASSLAFGTPVQAGALPASINALNPGGVMFDCDATGSRFLSVERTRPKDGHLQMILNWQSLLKR